MCSLAAKSFARPFLCFLKRTARNQCSSPCHCTTPLNIVLPLIVALQVVPVSAHFCGNNRIPYGIEIYRNGQPSLLCSRPSCFEKTYADCDERAMKQSCDSNSSWVGGFDKSYGNHQPLYVQCCEFESLALLSEPLYSNVLIRPGEYFEGEEIMDKMGDEVVSFDLITNLKLIPSSNRSKNKLNLVDQKKGAIKKCKEAVDDCQIIAESTDGRMLIFDFPCRLLQEEYCVDHGFMMGENEDKSFGPVYFNSNRRKPVEVKHILGDGNCLFRALSYFLSSSEENHAGIRRLLCNYINENSEEPWVEFWRNGKQSGIMEPANDASEVHKYGSTLHLIAAAKIFDANVLVFNEHSGWTLYTSEIETASSSEYRLNAEKPALPLLYNGNHFDVILKI